MSANEGHIYRIASTTATQLLKLIQDYLGDCWTFGAAAQWDFDPAQKQSNLRKVHEQKRAISKDDLIGDFGHAFSDKAEIRWKRIDESQYDVLILAEQALDIAGAEALTIPVWHAQSASWQTGMWTTRCLSNASIHLLNSNFKIRYVDYCAPNGAVQFQRLTIYVEKNDDL